MYIEVSFKNLLKAYLYFYIVADSLFFYLLPYTLRDSVGLRTMMALVAFAIYIFLALNGKLFNKIRQYKYLHVYIIFMIIVMVIESLYGMNRYGQRAIDVFIVEQPYFSLVTVPAFLFLFSEERDACRKMMRIFAIIGIINTLILLVSAIALDVGIYSTLPGFQIMGYRNGHVRVGYRTIGYYSMFYALDCLLNPKGEKKKFCLLYLIICFGGVLTFVSTRIITIALSVSCLFVLLVYTEKGRTRKILMVLVAVIITGIAFSGRVSNLFESFSPDSEVGASTVARVDAIDYYLSCFLTNPVLGMGPIRGYRADLLRIISGPNYTAVYEDLGLLGGLFRLGILGLLVMVIPLARMFYISLKLLIVKSKNAALLLGIVIFLLIEQISLNYLDYQRAVIASFYWAIIEYHYWENKKSL